MAVDMDLEAVLRAPEIDNGALSAKNDHAWPTERRWSCGRRTMEEVPTLLKAVRPTLDIPRDYYDIVGARLYAELLGWYRHRVRNEYCLVGQVDGYLVGIVNGRMVDEKIGMSYHTLGHRPRAAGGVAFVCVQNGIPYRISGAAGSLDYGGKPDRIPALDDRIWADQAGGRPA